MASSALGGVGESEVPAAEVIREHLHSELHAARATTAALDPDRRR